MFPLNFSYLPCEIKGVIGSDGVSSFTEKIKGCDCVCVIDANEFKLLGSQFAAQREIDNAFDSEV